MNGSAKKPKKYYHDGGSMQNDAALYLQFIEDEEVIASRRLRMAAVILFCESAALYWLWRQGFPVPLLGGLLRSVLPLTKPRVPNPCPSVMEKRGNHAGATRHRSGITRGRG